MDQKLSDFKEDLQALVKQYWGDADVIIVCSQDAINANSKRFIIIITDYEKVHGVT